MKQTGTLARRTVLKSVSTGIVGGLALTGSASAQGNGGLQRELAEVRSATAAYNDPENAVADGYIPEESAVCGMGYHYPHEDFIAALSTEDPAQIAAYLDSIDRTQPPVLAYGECDDGLVLGAVEYLTMDDEEDLFTSTGEDQWDPFFGPLYALHAWVHNHNPKGVFHPTNPREPFVDPGWCEDGGSHH